MLEELAAGGMMEARGPEQASNKTFCQFAMGEGGKLSNLQVFNCVVLSVVPSKLVLPTSLVLMVM